MSARCECRAALGEDADPADLWCGAELRPGTFVLVAWPGVRWSVVAVTPACARDICASDPGARIFERSLLR